MTDIERKYSAFGLTEEMRQRLLQLARDNEIKELRHIIVETVILCDGHKTVVKKKEQNA